jgi:hypothetical protein
MNSRVRFRNAALAAAAVAALGVAAATPASARVFVGFGFGVPVVGPAYYPYYYAPPPVVYAPPPPPVVVAPVQPTYMSQPTSDYYYCDNPRGYYPSVTSCSTAWRQVPAPPPR